MCNNQYLMNTLCIDLLWPIVVLSCLSLSKYTVILSVLLDAGGSLYPPEGPVVRPGWSSHGHIASPLRHLMAPSIGALSHNLPIPIHHTPSSHQII